LSFLKSSTTAASISPSPIFSRRGFGVDRDYDKARELFQKAADAGSAEGMTNMGLVYADGFGVDIDSDILTYPGIRSSRLGGISGGG
jgi:hypothetical protein